MAQCPYCEKYVVEGLVRCPHCFTRLSGTGSDSAPPRSRKHEQARRPFRPTRLLRLPVSRLLLIAFLGLVGILLIGLIAFAIIAPDSARALLVGPPTTPPPTARPTFTPSPAPTATPEWVRYQGYRTSYSVAFPPDWIVVDFADAGWKRTLRRLASGYPWLTSKLPEERLQVEADAQSLWSFDPVRSGDFAIHCRLDQSLAGLAVTEVREVVGERLLQIPGDLGGRAQGGVRTQIVDVAGQQAVMLELVILPGRDSEFDRPMKIDLYLLADEKQGYWIEVMRIEEEPAREDRIVQTVLASFRRTERAQ